MDRWQYYTGLDVIHEASGKTYYELKNAVETKSRQYYQCQHEPWQQGWKDGAAHLWATDQR